MKKIFTLIAAMLMTSAATWAADVELKEGNIIGAEDNSTGWYGQASTIFEIPANKTLTIKFKSYSATDAQLSGTTWTAYMSHAVQLWNGVEKNIFWRADGYGWQADGLNTTDASWYTFLGANTRWAPEGSDNPTLWREDITEMDVVFTIARVGTELRMTQDFTCASGKYRRYFVLNYGAADGSIWGQLTVERAHVQLTADAVITDTEVPAVEGTLIGLENNTTAFWTAWSEYYTIAPNSSFSLHFKNYNNQLNNWSGNVVYVTSDADRGDTGAGYTEYFGLRPDNWLNVANTNTGIITNYHSIDWNWPLLRQKLDGADVVLTVVRNGGDVTVRQEFTPADGSDMLYEEYTGTYGSATENIRVFLAPDGGHADILPTTYTVIGSYGDNQPLFSDAAWGVEAANQMTYDAVNNVYTLTLSGVQIAGGGNINFAVVENGTTLRKFGRNAAVGQSAYNCYLWVGDAGTYDITFTFDPNKNVTGDDWYVTCVATVSTGIDSLNNDTADQKEGQTYNLAGQRVDKSYKGIVISNGKKMLKK